MKRLRMNIYAVLAIMAVSVFAVGAAFGFTPIDPGTLTLDVAWLDGFTAHADGISLLKGAGVAASAAAALGMAKEADVDDPPDSAEDDAVARAVKAVFQTEDMRKMMQQMVSGVTAEETRRGMPSAPDLVPENQRHPDTRVVKQRDVDDKEGAYLQTSRIINGLRDSDREKLDNARSLLIKAGHYDHQLQQRGMDITTRRDDPETFARAGLTTLTFKDGGVFLPDIVINEAAMQDDIYGVVRQNAQRVPLIPGVTTYPKLTSKGRFSHLGEGSAITAVKEAFGSVEMRPRKAGRLTPWTRETNDVAGAAIMPVMNRVIAESREKLIDDDALNGDGTSTYGGINGVLGGNVSGVTAKTLATGKTSFADADWQDWTDLQAQVDSSAVANGIYVVNPLSVPKYLKRLKDGEGRPLRLAEGFFGFDNNGRLMYDGRPVYVTESMNGPSDDAVSTAFAVYGDFSQMYFGEMDGIVIDTFTSGTVPDPDGGSDINLISQDYIALRVIVFVEIKILFGNAFAYMQTAAS